MLHRIKYLLDCLKLQLYCLCGLFSGTRKAQAEAQRVTESNEQLQPEDARFNLAVAQRGLNSRTSDRIHAKLKIMEHPGILDTLGAVGLSSCDSSLRLPQAFWRLPSDEGSFGTLLIEDWLFCDLHGLPGLLARCSVGFLMFPTACWDGCSEHFSFCS